MESTSRMKQQEEILASSTIDNSALNTRTAIAHQPSLLYVASKRLLDIILSLIGIVALFPLFVVIALCIKLNDGGTILYIREMVGLHGRPFFMLKFRTMIPNADAYLQKQAELLHEFEQKMKLQNDPRITRVGRFLRQTYLDELPQLLNILVGHMSLVGPRAIHQRELALYGEYAEKRHSTRPGLTGLWQISPNRHRCYKERIPLDMQYIDTHSFILDLVILFKTLKVLIIRNGV